jgi:hypothetical protein
MFLRTLRRNIAAAAFVAISACATAGLTAVQSAQAAQQQRYSQNDVVDIGHNFFGSVSQAFATTVERAVAQYGQPNGYILGEEASGAYIGGLRYGEGTLFTRNAGDHRVFWQGPSVGFDWGGDGNRTMILVYNLDSIDALYKRFGGVSGSAYLVGGVGMTVLKNRNIALVPIRTGVGARLGINVGYLKLTRTPTWNPF